MVRGTGYYNQITGITETTGTGIVFSYTFDQKCLFNSISIYKYFNFLIELNFKCESNCDQMSKSQCNEELILFESHFKHKMNGTFIELGALDGLLYSNTKLLEDKYKWKGVLIEANPYEFCKIKSNRPNCEAFNSVVSDRHEPVCFRIVKVHSTAAVSGIDDTLPESHEKMFFHSNVPQEKQMIQPKSLTSIIKQSRFKTNTEIDFLSLDVEGHELEVLRSYDFSIPITYILVENLFNTTKDQEVQALLQSKGYKFITRIAHNDLFKQDA